MDRKECLDWLCRLRSEIYVYMLKEWIIPMNNALDMAIRALEHEPKTGLWEEVQFRTVPYNRISKAKKCSVCGKRKDKYVTWNYCPNCGMRNEVKE